MCVWGWARVEQDSRVPLGWVLTVRTVVGGWMSGGAGASGWSRDNRYCLVSADTLRILRAGGLRWGPDLLHWSWLAASAPGPCIKNLHVNNDRHSDATAAMQSCTKRLAELRLEDNETFALSLKGQFSPEWGSGENRAGNDSWPPSYTDRQQVWAASWCTGSRGALRTQVPVYVQPEQQIFGFWWLIAGFLCFLLNETIKTAKKQSSRFHRNLQL